MGARRDRRARVAVAGIFALNGALFASIFSRLPAIQDRTGLGPGALGLALLCSMAGLLLAQVIAGAVVARAGSRPLIIAGGLAYAGGLLPIALSTSFATLAASFALVGMSNGLLDLSMNVQGLTVERRLGRPVLASLHASFSFGALGGAAAGGAVAGAGVAVLPHLAVAACLGAATVLVASRFLLPGAVDAAPQGPMLARPTRALAALGAFAFCVLLAEGAVNDWVAVYLHRELDTGEGLAAAGLAVFSLTMAFGRLTGDRMTEAFGSRRLARGGSLLAGGGMAAAVAAGDAPTALAGFAAMGIGLAALFPLALRAASAQGAAAAPSVAAVSAVGYTGFLAGPPSVGGLAQAAGLRAGLGLVVVLCVVAAVLSPAVRAPQLERSRA
jgi:MFS family permease